MSEQHEPAPRLTDSPEPIAVEPARPASPRPPLGTIPVVPPVPDLPAAPGASLVSLEAWLAAAPAAAAVEPIAVSPTAPAHAVNRSEPLADPLEAGGEGDPSPSWALDPAVPDAVHRHSSEHAIDSHADEEPADQYELIDTAETGEPEPLPLAGEESVDAAAVEEVPADVSEQPAPAAAELPVDIEPVDAEPVAVESVDPEPLDVEPAGTGTEAAPSPEPLPLAASSPVIVPAEPTAEELSLMPVERDEIVPLTAVAAGALVTSAAAPETVPVQTSAEVFDHAHHDVETRTGILSYGILTKTAGVGGLAACVAGLVVLVTACAGYQTVFGRSLLGFGEYITYVAAGGLIVALLGGFIEHRRLREETHVLAAFFTNALAAVGGLLLWAVAAGVKFL
jgi:hypothetical protein